MVMTLRPFLHCILYLSATITEFQAEILQSGKPVEE